MPDDLRAVYSGAKALARSHDARYVDAWEMVGEPDVGYCTDLPDRLVAFQKAVYLGLKAGATESEDINRQTEGENWSTENGDWRTAAPRVPFVLMGALALPPGPWLDRAVRNGLLDYTDAYNFHFYGLAEDLTGVIAAHRVVARLANSKTGIGLPGTESQRPKFGSRIPEVGGRMTENDGYKSLNSQVERIGSGPPSVVHSPSSDLPLWVTECGINAVTTDDFLNPARRRLQAEFTTETARQALAAEDVAMFMPFILEHRNDPHAMTLSPSRTLPAWDSYAKFTRDNPWPNRQLSAPPKKPNPVVLQWMPDADAAVPHKVSGTYRFRQREPMRGEIRVYNFSAWTVRGRLQSIVPAAFLNPQASTLPNLSDLSVPAWGRVAVPVTLTAPATGYARGECEFVFADFVGNESKACFGLETWPESRDFTERPLELHPLPDGQIRFPEFPDYERGDFGGPWQTINDLHAAVAHGRNGYLFWIDGSSLDPLMPAMAFTAIDGVPTEGFLRVQLDQPMAPGRSVRVDLVDADGQRFCIWENLGQNYLVNSPEVWLNVCDMQIYFWGRCMGHPTFHPERVREIQLSFYRKNPGERMRVQLSWMTP